MDVLEPEPPSRHPGHAAAGPQPRSFDADQVAAQLFGGVLKREPGSGDVHHDGDYLRQHDPATAIRSLTTILTDSTEFRRRQQLEVGLSFIPDQQDDASRFPGGVISMGTHCYTGKLLQKAGLKAFSTPFDWLFTKAGMIAHCIEDDFATFLDPAHHRSLASDNELGSADHTLYRDRFDLPSIFNHRDPNPADSRGYYQRGVERFRRLQHGGKPFLCVMATPEWLTSVADFSHLADTLSRLVPMASLACIRVHSPQPDVLRAGYELVAQHGTHRAFDYRAFSHLRQLDFDSQLDNVALLALLARLRSIGPADA